MQPLRFEQSVRDTLVWLVDSGRLPARYAPRDREPAGAAQA